MERVIITGGAGFIGSAVIKMMISTRDCQVLNFDKLTYAGNLKSLASVSQHARYKFVKADICDRKAVSQAFHEFRPTGIIHLAAESHVDRSIDSPSNFIQTNIIGTHVLLDAALEYWKQLSGETKAQFRFHHVSTDEVYGSLDRDGLFKEETPYKPNSPYAASKASSDHLVRAWHKTYQLPVVMSNCGNNFGPFQFPEKLIPLVLLNALEEKSLPVYGTGENVRDWIFVNDHAAALISVFEKGRTGENYNIGGRNQKTNLEVVSAICVLLDEMRPRKNGRSYAELISFVQDRPGHDLRYAIDPSKIQQELGWTPRETFESGLRKTVQWFLENQDWCHRIQDGAYQRERLGLL